MANPSPVVQLAVLSHPDPNSFCAEIADRWCQRAERNHQICKLRDLYAEHFDPVLRGHEQPGKPGFRPASAIIEEAQRLQALDVLVLVYPVWFGAPPAMLKGYFERVVGCGMAFPPGETPARPLANVRLVQITTSASRQPWLLEKGIPSALHTILDKYVADVFGALETHHLYLDGVSQDIQSTYASELLSRVDALADKVCADANATRWARAQSDTTAF